MKIGVLTLPLDNNYGGNLQTYALMEALRSLGKEPILINRILSVNPVTFPLRVFARSILKLIFLKKNINVYKEIERGMESKLLGYKILDFIDEFLQPQTEKFDSSRKMKTLIGTYRLGAIIVGSDQVWRGSYTRNYQDYFLSFSENLSVKRLAYAASFGRDSVEYSSKQISKCQKLLKKFDKISVREESGIQICKEAFGVHADHIIDPTMLLQVKDYEKLFQNETDLRKDSGVLLYILDETSKISELIQRVSASLELTSYSVNCDIGDSTLSYQKRIKPSIASWLKGFSQAQFVITDSYHGTIFSILFNKPFLTVGNKKRGVDRFESLLNLFNLKERLVEDLGSIDDQLINSPICWDIVNKAIESERKKGLKFLSDGLQ
jgi:hypothetical protein